VALAAWPLAFVDAPAILKWLIVSGVTTVVCFTTYHYWVQDTWLGAFLNGKRFQLDWPWRTSAAPVGALQGKD
jgi:glucan biosynthesis protein C